MSEHYLGSLLFNWERTRDFVTSLRSLSVWTLDQDENGADIKLLKEPKSEARKFPNKGENEDSTFAQMRVLNETNLELMASLGVFFARPFSSYGMNSLLVLKSIDQRLLQTDRTAHSSSS